MAKTKSQKQELLNLYKDLLTKADGVFVIKPIKITPNEVNEFRKELFDIDSNFHVIKNSIFKIALKESNLPEIEELNNGEHAVLFTKENVAEAAKSLKKFIENTTDKKNKVDRVIIVKGIMDGSLLSAEQVRELSDMPSFEGSISMILGILDNAISGVLNVLEDAPRAYVSIIDQHFKQ